MEPSSFLEILSVAEKLKCAPRHCYTSSGRRESVAEHSWRLCLMALLLKEEEAFADVDMDKVMQMCVIHDLGEAFTGDIPTFRKTTEDARTEDELLLEWVDTFPAPQRSLFRHLLEEMGALKSREARVYKALDKLEALISHNESDLSTWLPLEYDLQLTYGQEEMKVSPYFEKLRSVVDDWTRRKIAAGEGLKEVDKS